MPRRGNWTPSLGLTLALACSPTLAGASGPLPATERFEGEPIVAMHILAPSDTEAVDLLRLAGLTLGSPLSSALVRSAVERLYQVDRFRSVVIRAIPGPNGGVQLELRLDPRRRLSSIVVPSSGGIATGWIRQVLGVEPGAEIDERELPGLQDRLRDALERRGWYRPAIGLALSSLDERGRTELIVRVDPGPPTRLGRVRIRGRLPFPEWRLDVGIESGDVLDLERVEPTLSRLEADLRAEGYLDAEVPLPRVEPGGGRPDEPRADLLLEVRPGPKVEVRFEGNRRVPRRWLEEEAAVLTELGSGEAALTEAAERILALYELLGHHRARVEVAGRTTPDGRRRQVLFQIREGPGSRVVDLRFPGASFFETKTLRAQVRETVERFLTASAGRPGVDPEVVGRVLRGVEPDRPRRQPSTEPPDPAAVYVPRAYRAAAETIADLYRSEGFQTVRVDGPKVELDRNELVRLEYPVEEGARWMIGSVAFAGHQGLTGAELLNAVGLDLAPGKETPLAFERVEEGRRAIVDLYRDRGYLFATVEEELREVPERGRPGGRFFSPRTDLAAVCTKAAREGKASCAVEVAYRIEEGPQVRIRDIIVRGLEDTRLSVVEGELRIRSGELLSEAKLAESRNNLVRLGVFDRVAVRPVEEERPALVKDVLVEVKERDHLSLDLGVGASTEEGLRVFGAFGDRNLFGRALRLRANAKVNLWMEPLLSIYDETLQEQIRPFYQPFGVVGPRPLLLLEYELALGVSYPRIFLLPPGFSFGLDLILVRDYDPAFAEDNQRVTLIGNYDGFKPEVLGRPRPMALQLRVNVERSELDCNDAVEGREDLCSSGVADANLGDRTEGENAYVSVGPRVSWDFRDAPLDPRSGAYLELEGELASGFDAQSPSYGRLEGRADAYAPVAPRVTFVTSLRGGRIFPVTSDQEIPLNRRFFAGGRSTIRGYPEKTLLPQDLPPFDETGEPTSEISTGGLLYLAFKTELRVLLVSPVSIAGFFDIGDLWRLTDVEGACESSLFETTCTVGSRIARRRLAQAAGFGLRVATPIGPLAIDIGFPLNRRGRAVEEWTLHFSVGAL